MLVDTKYFPLLGLSGIQSKVLGLFSESKWKIQEEYVEKYLDFLFVKLKDEMKGRLSKIESLHLKKHIEPSTHSFYRERS